MSFYRSTEKDSNICFKSKDTFDFDKNSDQKKLIRKRLMKTDVLARATFDEH
jgi:hypothetical protein